MRTRLPFHGRVGRLAASVAASWLALMALAAPSPASAVARAEARGSGVRPGVTASQSERVDAAGPDAIVRFYGRCAVPLADTVLASSATAVVYAHTRTFPGGYPEPALTYMGCLAAVGRERVLERFASSEPPYPTHGGGGRNYDVVSATLAGGYAALVLNETDYFDGGPVAQSIRLQVYDLRTGRLAPGLGGEITPCGVCVGRTTVDDVVLGSDGVSAVRIAGSDIPIEQVGCAPGTTMCVAIDEASDVFSSADPFVGGAGAWRETTESLLVRPWSVTCASVSLCLLAGWDVLISTHPADDTWRATGPPGVVGSATDVSCPSTTLCLASEDYGVAFSTHPAGGSDAWSFTPIPKKILTSLFCSSLRECFASSYPTPVLASTDPTGGTQAWQPSPSTPPFISGTCPTSTLCVAFNTTFIGTGLGTGYYINYIYAATDPGSGPWAETSVPDAVSGIACPSASFCVAVGDNGMLATSTDPAFGIWTSTTIDHGIPLDAIACPSVSRCVATDDDGQILISTNPAGGSSAWTTVSLDGCQTNPCSVEQILVSDGTGLHAVDHGAFQGKGPFLTNLKLTGDVLSWDHDGTPRSTVLQP